MKKNLVKQGLKEQLWMSSRPLDIRIEIKISVILKKDNKKAKKIEET